MRSIQQPWMNATLLLFSLFHSAISFQPQTLSHRRHKIGLRAIVDPTDITSSAASSLQHHEHLQGLLSTMLSTAMQPAAHGHSNPFFGPPDPILEAGKSIAPSAKALADMGITHANTAADLVPDASPDFQEQIAEVMKQGDKVMNKNNIVVQGGDTLPGFAPTRGILPTRMPEPDATDTFIVDTVWAAKFVNVMDKLPYAAFWYAMVEFFVLRPNADLYKEDVETDPAGVTTDAFSVFAVRCAVFAVIAIVTNGLFG